MKKDYEQLLENLNDVLPVEGGRIQITDKSDLSENARAYFMDGRVGVNSLYEDATECSLLLNNTDDILCRRW